MWPMPGIITICEFGNERCRISAPDESSTRSSSSQTISVGVASPITSCSRCGTSRSEEHTSELQSLMRISYAVFCLKKKKKSKYNTKQQDVQYQRKSKYMLSNN